MVTPTNAARNVGKGPEVTSNARRSWFHRASYSLANLEASLACAHRHRRHHHSMTFHFHAPCERKCIFPFYAHPDIVCAEVLPRVSAVPRHRQQGSTIALYVGRMKRVNSFHLYHRAAVRCPGEPKGNHQEC